MSSNQIRQPLLLVALLFVVVALFSFIPADFEVLNFQPKRVDILSDLKPSSPDTDEGSAAEEYNEDDEYYYEGEMETIYDDESDSGASNDSSLLEGSESVNLASTGILFEKLYSEIGAFMSGDADNTRNSSIDVKDQKITGNVGQLRKFFKALKNSKNRMVRIAHFGDSMIEGDLITADIRSNLQQRFGGKGVGWLSITSQDINFRASTKQTFSDGWEMYSIYTNNPQKLPLGISGEVFVPKNSSWCQYEPTRKYRTMRSFQTARLFYSDAKATQVKYIIDGRKMESARLKKGSHVNEIVIDGKREHKKIRFEMTKDAGYFYGVSLEGGNGVYVDNYPLRGNSGVDIMNIPDDKLKEFNKMFHYDLVILEFGLNALGTIKGNYNWYEKEMEKVIDKFKSAFPNASLLMIGVHDKAVKKGSKFVTDVAILKLLKAQQNIVRESKIAFWNIFEAMGGKNSMHNWVDANPPLAYKDYTHFNEQGAKKIGGLFADALIDAYDNQK